MSDVEKFEDEYSEEGFWAKLASFAKVAGIEVIEKHKKNWQIGLTKKSESA